MPAAAQAPTTLSTSSRLTSHARLPKVASTRSSRLLALSTVTWLKPRATHEAANAPPQSASQGPVPKRGDPPSPGQGPAVAGLRRGAPVAPALPAAGGASRPLPRAFAPGDWPPPTAHLLALPAETITPGKMTYDLRRLRQHGLIERIPHTFRYQVTGTGIAHALFLMRCPEPSGQSIQ